MKENQDSKEISMVLEKYYLWKIIQLKMALKKKRHLILAELKNE